MHSKLLFCFLIFNSFCCSNTPSETKNKQNVDQIKITTNQNPYQIVQQIPLPAEFNRVKQDSNSFGTWLRNVRLKRDKTVYLYNGLAKRNQSAQFAVLNIPTGNKDLQQCADGVMRLRAEYLFANKKFDDIIFYDNEKGVYKFSQPFTRCHFDKYLEKVFAMCGSASLSKQLKHKSISDIMPGDVLIHGGFPGHSEIVMDVATNKNGKKIYMLAQSYMPAQDIHILNNPTNKDLSPWYELNDKKTIETSEYYFTSDELKTWSN